LDSADDKITIIEGPPPTFGVVNEEWELGLIESSVFPVFPVLAVTQLRTFNGAELVERCHRAWRKKAPIHLEYRSEGGLKQEAPIVAARNVDTEDGDLLFLWVRLPDEYIEYKREDLGTGDDPDNDLV
jgi:hypothetical protein